MPFARLAVAVVLLAAVGCQSPLPSILCTDSSTGRCDCSATQTVGATTQACSAATVGAPSLCCATNNYPRVGGCSCMTFACASFDVAGGRSCQCGQAKPAGTTVARCTPGAGEVCCVSTMGDRCTCSTTACFAGETEVDDCAIERIGRSCAVQLSVAYSQMLEDCR